MVIPICSRGTFISPPEGLETMRQKTNSLPMIGLCVLVLAIATGCGTGLVNQMKWMAPTVRAHPQLQGKLASIKTVAVMPPGVTVYQIAVGRAIQVMDEETAVARPTLATAIEQELGRDAGVVFTPFPSSLASLDASRDPAAARLTAELEDTQALFEAVSASIVLHTYYHGEGALYDWRFVEKLKNFDYSLGPDVQQFAKLANADALLFISGVDHISTGGRKARIKARMVLLPLITSPTILLQAPPFFLPPGNTALSVALVDATTGALLWYNVAAFQGGVHSLTDPHSVTDLTAQVLMDFPLVTRPTRKEHDQNAWPIGLGPR